MGRVPFNMSRRLNQRATTLPMLPSMTSLMGRFSAASKASSRVANPSVFVAGLSTGFDCCAFAKALLRLDDTQEDRRPDPARLLPR